MGRRAQWPPIPRPHVSGQDRVCYKGETYYLGPTGSAEARQRYAALLRKLGEEGGGTDASEILVRQAVHLWFAHTRERYPDSSTEPDHHEWAMAPVLELFGHLAVKDFDVVRLEDVRDRMIEGGLCRNVINRRITRVRTAWRWMERKGHAPKGAWAHLRSLEPLSRQDRRVKNTEPVKPAEWLAVEATCERMDEAPKALLLLLWHTGARPSELFGLRAEHIDRSAEVWTFRPARHKGSWRGHERLIVFGPEAQSVLAPWLEGCHDKVRTREAKMEGCHDKVMTHPEAFVFLNRRGRPFNRMSFYHAVRRASMRAGVKMHAYQTRHAARRRVAREMGGEAARVFLGHKHASMTEQYASSPDVEAAMDVARRCG